MSTPQIEAHVVELPAQPFIARTGRVGMAAVGEVADLIPGLFAWLGRKGHAPVGPPFLRYQVIDMAGELVIQAGVPVAATPEDTDKVETGELPAGRYVATTHVGHFDQLPAVTRQLLDWAAVRGLEFDRHDSADGDVWASRVEWYETDPAEEPDPRRWVTRLTFRLAD